VWCDKIKINQMKFKDPLFNHVDKSWMKRNKIEFTTVDGSLCSVEWLVFVLLQPSENSPTLEKNVKLLRRTHMDKFSLFSFTYFFCTRQVFLSSVETFWRFLLFNIFHTRSRIVREQQRKQRSRWTWMQCSF
jgi:hypothetical protein